MITLILVFEILNLAVMVSCYRAINAKLNLIDVRLYDVERQQKKANWQAVNGAKIEYRNNTTINDDEL